MYKFISYAVIMNLFQASQLLNENNAEYPKRISHKCPQNLAIEALEIYYRIHASILKYLEQHEGESIKRSLATVFTEILQVCLNGPFMTQNSVLSNILKTEEEHVDSEGHINDVQLRNEQEVKGLIQSTDLAITASCNEATKCEGRKRCSELQIDNNIKRIKLNNISHLELMQDVLELTDDLITEVCNKVSSDQYELVNEDHQYNVEKMYCSTNIETERNNPSCSTLRNIHNAYISESESRNIEAHPVIENEILKKGDLKKARNENLEMVIQIILIFFPILQN